jgi:hypothetical protein
MALKALNAASRRPGLALASECEVERMSRRIEPIAGRIHLKFSFGWIAGG